MDKRLLYSITRKGKNNPAWKNAGWHFCFLCKKQFHSYNKRKFCSRFCFYQSLFGKPNPNAVKAMNKAIKGKPAPWNRNPIKIEKQRIKMLGRKRPEHSKNMIGNKNSNWHNNSSLQSYAPGWFSKELHNQIKRRDKNSCKICKKTVCNLFIHHIDYNKQNHNKINLICLCNSCHSKTNFNRSFWKSLLQQIQSEYYSSKPFLSTIQ